MLTFKQFCSLKENASGDGSVSGLGLVSGMPAVNKDNQDTYLKTNSLTKDNENGNLLDMLRKSQSSIHKKIGFDAYNPSKKGKK